MRTVRNVSFACLLSVCWFVFGTGQTRAYEVCDYIGPNIGVLAGTEYPGTCTALYDACNVVEGGTEQCEFICRDVCGGYEANIAGDCDVEVLDPGPGCMMTYECICFLDTR